MFSALISEDTSKLPTFFRLHLQYLGKENLITAQGLIILKNY